MFSISLNISDPSFKRHHHRDILIENNHNPEGNSCNHLKGNNCILTRQRKRKCKEETDRLLGRISEWQRLRSCGDRESRRWQEEKQRERERWALCSLYKYIYVVCGALVVGGLYSWNATLLLFRSVSSEGHAVKFSRGEPSVKGLRTQASLAT